MIKLKKNQSHKKKSTWVNLTNPLSMIWNQDKKKIRLSKERSSKKDWS
jgi:hypothetical protein